MSQKQYGYRARGQERRELRWVGALDRLHMLWPLSFAFLLGGGLL